MNKIREILIKYKINGFGEDGGTDKSSEHTYDEYYSKVFEEYIDKNISLLEIGILYGGSALLWSKLFPNSKLVFIDSENNVSPKIWSLMDENNYDFLIQDAFTDETIKELQLKYDGFDIIVEDGPHTLESQIFTIKNYSKLLKEGGILIIEDIQDYDYCETIINNINKEDFKSVEIIDLRKHKNRSDDILIVVKK
jgi:SAM-dependent methyltransferase